jgi:hypothetical protein
LNITLFHATENFGGINYSSGIIAQGVTNSTGGLKFTWLVETNYTAVIAYQAYSQPAINLTNHNIALERSQLHTINHLNLTRLIINLKTYSQNPEDLSLPIQGAKVNLYWNKTGEPNSRYIGSQSTDSEGECQFYWFNASESEGNYTIMVEFYNKFLKINTTISNPLEITNMVNFTLPNYTMIEVSAQIEDYHSILYKPANQYYIYWGQLFNLSFSFKYGSTTEEYPIEGALLSYRVMEGDVLLHIGYMSPNGNPGDYNLTFYSNDPQFDLETDVLYYLEVEASKAGFSSKTESMVFQLLKRTTDSTLNITSIQQYWNENLSIGLYYNDTIGNLPIDGAVIDVTCIQIPDMHHSFLVDEEKGPGWYVLTLNSTEFQKTGDFVLQIAISKVNYVSIGRTASVKIQSIPTSLAPNIEDVTVYWGENFSIGVQFWNNFLDLPIIDGDVTCNVLPYVPGIAGVVPYEENSAGWYLYTLNSTQFEKPGNYTMQFYASKAFSVNQTRTITLNIKAVPTQMVAITPIEMQIDWLQNVSIVVDLFDIRNYIAPIPIFMTDISYSVGQLPGLNGYLDYDENIPGRYSFNMNSTHFTATGYYNIRIEAIHPGFQSQTMDFFVLINRIRTLINSTAFLSSTYSMNVTTDHKFYFNYSDFSGHGVENAIIAMYEWNRVGSDETYSGTLLDFGNGLYMLDFNSMIRPIGTYYLLIQIGQNNYIDRMAALTLTIVPRPIVMIPDSVMNTSTIEIEQGLKVNLRMRLQDPVNSDEPLNGARIAITYDGKGPFTFDDEGDGFYSYEFTTEDYNALINTIPLQVRIDIQKENYTITPFTLTIAITPPQIWGIPKMYVYIAVGVAIILGILYGTISLVRYIKIPPFIKRLDETLRIVSKRKKLKEGKVAPPATETVLHIIGNKWQALNLNLRSLFNPASGPLMNVTPGDQKKGGLE